MRRSLYLSVFFLSLATLSMHASTIVVNGSFESPALTFGAWTLNASIPGWSLASGPAIEVQNHAAGNPFDGNQFVELDSTGESAIYQDLTTIAGAEYLLRFAFSPRMTVPDNIMQVLWDHSPVTTVSANGVGMSSTNWTVYSFIVYASGTTTRLQFSGLGTSDSLGEYLDAVSVDPVPEPTTSLLCLGGLLFAATMYRKYGTRRP